MTEPMQVSEILSTGIKQAENPPFVSVGYDYTRIGKAFSKQEVECLKSICDFYDDKYHYKQNSNIAFQIHFDTLVFLCICPPKLLRFGNVILATPDEIGKALNKVERMTGFSFWSGYVAELHFTINMQTPEPFACYRTILQVPYQYRREEETDGDYFNSKRITMFIYDKAKQCKGIYTSAEQSEFSGTFTPELFRAEIRLEKEVRKVLVSAKCWDKSKTEFLATDLVRDDTFRNLTLFAKKFIPRFLKPMVKNKPNKIISDNALFRVQCATENGYAYFVELHEKGFLSKEMLRKATKYHNEAKEQRRNEYIQKQLTDKITATLAEYEPERSIDLTAKRALEKLSKSKIQSLPPNSNVRRVQQATQ